MNYIHAKDKIKAPSSERAKEGYPAVSLFSFSPIAQETSTKGYKPPRPDKHSDLGGEQCSLSYGNGCCRGFSPQFPYPRIHRQAVHPTTRKSADETHYSFVLKIFYYNKRDLSIALKSFTFFFRHRLLRCRHRIFVRIPSEKYQIEP